jgi:hypothetical protein
VTYGTSGHVGGRGGGDNAHTQVNMGVPLLPDPLVWHVTLPLHSSDKTYPNVPFVLLTSVLLIMLYALMMLLAVIGKKHQIWSDSAAVWQAIITLFIRNGPIMMETIKKAWYYLSCSLTPLLWINLLALSLSYWRDKDKDMDTCLCHEKHVEPQHHRCYNAKRGQMRQGSIRDFTIYIQATLSIFANKDCTEDVLLMSANGCMNAEVTPNVATAANELLTVTETMAGIQCKPEEREEETIAAAPALQAIDVVAPTLQTIIQPKQIHLLKVATTGLNDSIKQSGRLWYM